MEKLFAIVGNLVAWLGILMCLGAGIARLVNIHHILGQPAFNIFVGGIAFMVMSCLMKLYNLEKLQRSES